MKFCSSCETSKDVYHLYGSWYACSPECEDDVGMLSDPFYWED
jgi:hypothetical protein